MRSVSVVFLVLMLHVVDSDICAVVEDSSLAFCIFYHGYLKTDVTDDNVVVVVVTSVEEQNPTWKTPLTLKHSVSVK
jgi:hypothetical protein